MFDADLIHSDKQMTRLGAGDSNTGSLKINGLERYYAPISGICAFRDGIIPATKIIV